jgi:hypothetical protein
MQFSCCVEWSRWVPWATDRDDSGRVHPLPEVLRRVMPSVAERHSIGYQADAATVILIHRTSGASQTMNQELGAIRR